MVVLLSFFLFLRLLLLIYFAHVVPLSEEEAQYWNWSQMLDYGYYSKPPGVAWQIFLSTKLLGNTELGVRFSSMVLGSGISLGVYWSALRAGFSQRVGFIAGVLLAVIPGGVVGSFLAITDVGMLLFWVLAMGYLLGAERVSSWKFGALVGLGALFKWAIFFLYPLVLIWAWISNRTALRPLLWSLPVALLGLLPSFIWNLERDFVTFRHVATTMAGGHYGSRSNVWEFLGAQIFLLSPGLFALFVMVWRYPLKTRQEVLLGVLSLAFVPLLVASFGMKIQGNWADFFLPAAVLFTVARIDQMWQRSDVLGYVWVSCVALWLVPWVTPLPYAINPLKNTLGWDRLGEVVESVGYRSQDHFLAAETYQVASLLGFYGPDQDRAYFVNVKGRRFNQFSFWPSLQEDHRRQGFFVTSQHIKNGVKDPIEFGIFLEEFFEKVDFIEQIPLYYDQAGRPVRLACVYKVEGYRGIARENERLF